MTAIKFENFKGMWPKVSARLIPPTHATEATNVKLLSGELRGIRQLDVVKEWDGDVSNTRNYKRVHRMIDEDTDYVTADSIDSDIMNSPIAQDSHDRYYQSDGTNEPTYNTKTRIQAGDPWYHLGVPAPTNTPSVSVLGGTGPTVSRYYVYTLVSAYGEEGPPSTVSTVTTGFEDGTWTVSNFDTAAVSDRNITHINIYRTEVSNTGLASFFYVTQISYGTTSYADTNTPAVVTANDVLTSTTWYPPETGLADMHLHPGGFAVGFVDNIICFSEPNRPHAWPPEYQFAIDKTIVAVKVFGNSVAVLTEGSPLILTGSHPVYMTASEVPSIEPCVSSNSVVGMDNGVLYASQNGLILLTLSGALNTTKQMISKEDWLEDFSPSTLDAARYQDMYIALSSTDNGFFVRFDDDQPDIVFLDKILQRVTGTAPTGVSIQNDYRTGEVLIVSYGNQTLANSFTDVYLWDISSQPMLEYDWYSKEVFLPDPDNLGAGIVYATEDVKGTAAKQVPADVGVTPTSDASKPSFVRVSVYIEGEDAPVFDQMVKPNHAFTMPSRRKSEVYKFRIRSNMNVYSAMFATNGMELKSV